jgi:Sulfotransferase domain
MTHIYIVGYPKSGNTWLARMLAKATGFPVKSSDDANPEVAADVNKAIENAGMHERGYVFKLHQTPNDFVKQLARENDQHKSKVVYIYRDIADVFISSFFYFKKSGIERYVEKPNNLLMFLNPIWLLQRIRWRVQLNRYLRSFIQYGYAKNSITYAGHLSAWFEYLKRCDGKVDYAVTKYEDLLNDPAHELKRICDKLGFHDLDLNLLGKISRSESFSSRKKDIEKTPDELTFGKEFNKRFLRSGKAGDHKRFLTYRQIMLLHATILDIESEPD